MALLLEDVEPFLTRTACPRGKGVGLSDHTYGSQSLGICRLGETHGLLVFHVVTGRYGDDNDGRRIVDVVFNKTSYKCNHVVVFILDQSWKVDKGQVGTLRILDIHRDHISGELECARVGREIFQLLVAHVLERPGWSMWAQNGRLRTTQPDIDVILGREHRAEGLVRLAAAAERDRAGPAALLRRRHDSAFHGTPRASTAVAGHADPGYSLNQRALSRGLSPDDSYPRNLDLIFCS